MKKPFKTDQLIDQSNALTLYLEALLNEVCVEEEDSGIETSAVDQDHTRSEQESPSPIAANPQTVVVQDHVVDVPVPYGQSLPEQLPSQESRPHSQEESQSTVTSSNAPVIGMAIHARDQADSQEVSEQNKQHEAPAWAVPRCQVLTFTLGTMQMAAPLDQLNGIIPMPDRLTVLPGQSPWFMGLARNRDQNVQVVDLASVIQPQRRLGSAQENANRSQYILLIGEGQWGVLCDSISTVLTLEPQQVQWQRSPHVDYILGTVIDQMHSVLCIDTLLNRLNNGQLV
jgi:chemotaxis signal transduction protein